MTNRTRFVLVALQLVWGLGSAHAALLQSAPPDGTTIRRVEVKGLTSTSEGYVRRIVKTRETQPFSLKQTEDDVRELLRSRKFLDASADAKMEEGEAVVTFSLLEKAGVTSVEIEGNKRFTSEELFKELSFSAGSPQDLFEINRGRENILRRYKEKGFHYAAVSLNEELVKSEGRVLFVITEGPRVKVRRILFENIRSFPEPRLKLMVKSKTWFPILSVGAFDEEQADRDAVEIQTFYRNEGYLDARVGYRLDFEDVERTKLTLVYVIEEGPRYRIKAVTIGGNTVFDEARIREAIELKVDGFVRDEVLKADVKRLDDLYGEIGYVDARIATKVDFVEDPEVVVIAFNIIESGRSQFGRITVRGNKETKDEVIRRELRFYPGEDYNTVKARNAERRLTETGLFTKATISPLDDEDGEREALVEVEEADTTDFLIGAGVSTDSGVVGTVTIQSRNFDISNWPRTWGEFLRGQSFRGDGQRLRLQLEPGTEVSRFRVDFTEPYFLDRNLRLDLSAYLFQRARGPYNEERIGFTPSISKRFDSGLLAGWALEGALRVEGIGIQNVDPLAASVIRDVKGDSFLTSLKATLVHDTTDSRVLPTQGHRMSIGWEQVGALGGDYDFSKPTASFVWYKTMRTDVFDRKSVLAVRGDVGYIAGDAPMFERFYAGGFGSVRGFSFRGISPRAGIYDDRVGGDFVVLTGAEYSVPLYADNIRGVTFIDMGTVEDDFGVGGWRASIGFGLRVNLQFFGPVPLVFDFGFPIATGKEDNTQMFNFSIGASF